MWSCYDKNISDIRCARFLLPEKFTKFGKQVSIGQTHNRSKFPCHTTRNVRTIRCRKFLLPQKWTKVHQNRKWPATHQCPSLCQISSRSAKRHTTKVFNFCLSPISEFPSKKAIRFRGVQTWWQISHGHISVLSNTTVTQLGMLVVLQVVFMLLWPWPDPRSRSWSRGFWSCYNCRKLHFSRSISSAISAWSSNLMIDLDSTGPILQIVRARFSKFLVRKLSCEFKLRGMSILHDLQMAIFRYRVRL